LDDVTLSPADILTINVHFTDDKMLQVNSSPRGVSFDFVLSNGMGYGSGNQLNNGRWDLDFLRYDDWLYPHTNGIPYVGGAPNPARILSALSGLQWDPVFEGVENGACFGDFTFTFRMPTHTTVGGFPGGSVPIETTTFTDNSITLYARGGGSWISPPTLQVVPEPMSIALFGLGGLLLRKRRAT
jgi:hypothetical protein